LMKGRPPIMSPKARRRMSSIRVQNPVLNGGPAPL
jgi:hypothetical protein